VNLGARLKEARQRSGLGLREVARQLSVSPSFISQMENGKSTPSVATLYSLAQLLNVSIDELFSGDDVPAAAGGLPVGLASTVAPVLELQSGQETINRSDLGSPADAWPKDHGLARLSITHPGERKRLEMGSGVIWEQLATNTGPGLDFMEIIYPPHSTSTNDKRMLQHAGFEFGYLLEGQLEITVGFEIFTVTAGDALGFDSAMPHLLVNTTDRAARGIWVVRHPNP
jgi:transcriptional regulator with XRE-family HTH domain/mannose-6-phosphate isomerase-like protein (cupin superfamily)